LISWGDFNWWIEFWKGLIDSQVFVSHALVGHGSAVYGIKGYNLSSKDANGRYRNMEIKSYYVYILTNQSNRVLYTGVTNNLERRVYEHKNKVVEGFTRKYNCNKLVWYETTGSIESAITREKQIKAGSRAKKILLVETINPTWKDLSLDWV
jgi:putative endonuclease